MSLSSDEKNTIIRNLISDIRKKKKKSANTVANLCGLSQQYLSEIERGKKFPSWTVIRDVFKVLDVNFNEDESLYDDAKSSLKRIISAYLSFDKALLETNVNELCLNKYYFSYAYFYHKLALIIRMVFINHRENIKLLPPDSSETELRMLWLICNAKSLTDSESRLSIINDALNLVTSHIKNPYEEGLHASLLVDLAEIKESNNQFYDALKLYETALTETAINYYTYFALSIELRIASLYSKMGQASTSNTLNRAIIDKTSHSYPAVHYAALFNLASNQMISGDYSSCIKTVKPLLGKMKNNEQYASLHYLLAFSYYMLDDYSNALENCNKIFIQTDCAEICKEFATAISNIILKRDNDKNLKKLFKTCLAIGDRGDISIAYFLLRKRLLEKNDFKSAYECADMYLSLLTCRTIE